MQCKSGEYIDDENAVPAVSKHWAKIPVRIKNDSILNVMMAMVEVAEHHRLRSLSNNNDYCSVETSSTLDRELIGGAQKQAGEKVWRLYFLDDRMGVPENAVNANRKDWPRKKEELKTILGTKCLIHSRANMPSMPKELAFLNNFVSALTPSTSFQWLNTAGMGASDGLINDAINLAKIAEAQCQKLLERKPLPHQEQRFMQLD